MGTNSTLLCIHRDPGLLSLLKENGYELIGAANSHDGLQLFRSRSVDAVVIEHHLGLLDGAAIAGEIKKIRPEVPIVMLADRVELPGGVLKSVDAFVDKSDGPHFLWATVHFILNAKPAKSRGGRIRSHLRRPGKPRGTAERRAGQPCSMSD